MRYAAAHECRCEIHSRLRPYGLSHVVSALEALHARVGSTAFAEAWAASCREGWANLASQLPNTPRVGLPGPRRGAEAHASTAASPPASDLGAGDERQDFRPNQAFNAAVDPRRAAVWASGMRGLVRFDLSTGDVRRYTMADGLITNCLGLVHVNPVTGDLWVGSTFGATRLRVDDTWETHDRASGVMIKDYAIPVCTEPDSGTTWFALGSGRVGTFSTDGRWGWRDLPSPLDTSSTAMVIAIDPLTGDRWFGTEHGAMRLGRDGRWSPVVWPGAPISSICFDTRRGHVYLSSVARIARVGARNDAPTATIHAAP